MFLTLWADRADRSDWSDGSDRSDGSERSERSERADWAARTLRDGILGDGRKTQGGGDGEG